MPAHKHADLMRLYAEDALETDKPWELWEYSQDDGTTWHGFDAGVQPCWLVNTEYRRKPKTITINGRELVAPERVAPAVGAKYWIPSLHALDYIGTNQWTDDSSDRRWLECGMVFLRRDDATALTKALLSLLKGADQ